MPAASPAVAEKPGVARRDLAKRLFVRGAKALHENPIVYPTLVAAFRILQLITTGKYTPLGTPLDAEATISRLAALDVVPLSVETRGTAP